MGIWSDKRLWAAVIVAVLLVMARNFFIGRAMDDALEKSPVAKRIEQNNMNNMRMLDDMARQRGLRYDPSDPDNPFKPIKRTAPKAKLNTSSNAGVYRKPKVAVKKAEEEEGGLSPAAMLALGLGGMIVLAGGAGALMMLGGQEEEEEEAEAGAEAAAEAGAPPPAATPSPEAPAEPGPPSQEPPPTA